MTPKRYGVRRFCPQGSRPDCFEVYHVATGDCASFGMTKRQAEQTARKMNKDFEEQMRQAGRST